MDKIDAAYVSPDGAYLQQCNCNARLAQSVEHQTFKAGQNLSYLRVKGSSPLLGVFLSMFKKIGRTYFSLCNLLLKMFNSLYFAIQTKPHTVI